MKVLEEFEVKYKSPTLNNGPYRTIYNTYHDKDVYELLYKSE